MSKSLWINYFYFSNGSTVNQIISNEKTKENIDSLRNKLTQLEQIGTIQGILWIANDKTRHAPYFLLDTGEVYYDTRDCLGNWENSTFRFGLLRVTKISHAVEYFNNGYVKNNYLLEEFVNFDESKWLFSSNKKQRLHLILNNLFLFNVKNQYWFQKTNSLDELMEEVSNYYGL